MTLIRHVVYILVLFFPIVWIYLVGKETLSENVLLGFGGFITSLFFYLQGVWNNKKTKTLILHHVKEKLNSNMVLLSHQETLQLGYLMKYFIKQKGRIQNSNNNTEGLSQYKITEKIKRKLNEI